MLAFRGAIADIPSTAFRGGNSEVNVDPSTPLLWAIREQVGLTGTKYGCGVAQCGACTVHVDGAAVRSCAMPVSAAVGKQITTIEGLAAGGVLHKVQKAWVDHEVPQCLSPLCLRRGVDRFTHLLERAAAAERIHSPTS